MQPTLRKTLALALFSSALAFTASAQNLEPLERLTGDHSISEEGKENRIFVLDAVFNHLSDSRVHVFDGETGKFLGMIPTSYNGHMEISNDGKKIYTMATYYERVTRGERTDTVEIWDDDTLTFEKEIILPNYRVQALNYKGIFRQTPDGKFILAQNATPASSVAVVDLEKEEHVAELTATAGCWSIVVIPNKPHSFATVCGDGTLLTIDLDDEGQIAQQSRSDTFFSPKDDPVFIEPAFLGDTAYFVSFYGNVRPADLSGDEAEILPSWSLLNDEDRAEGWAPGGYNLTGVHEGNKRFYVLMHADAEEGTHKNPADEIWVFDLESQERVARVPGMHLLSISIDEPGNRLLGLDGGNVHIFDISEDEPKHIRTIENAGEAALHVEPFPNVKG